MQMKANRGGGAEASQWKGWLRGVGGGWVRPFSRPPGCHFDKVNSAIIRIPADSLTRESRPIVPWRRPPCRLRPRPDSRPSKRQITETGFGVFLDDGRAELR